ILGRMPASSSYSALRRRVGYLVALGLNYLAPMDAVELVAPTATFRDSYCSLVGEIIAAGETLVPFVLEFEHNDFGAFLRRLDQSARGVDLPQGFVAHSTY